MSAESQPSGYDREMSTTPDAPPSPPGARAVITSVVWGMSPVSLFFVLNYMRPDLMAPMLDHVFGYTLARGVGLVVLISTVIYVFALFRTKRWRIALTIGGSLLCTLPALFAVLFGPIVFAFMFGNVDPQR
jgi:hypothetical protein